MVFEVVMQYVIFNGKKFKIEGGILNLREEYIENINDIKRVKNLIILKELDLCDNFIIEMKGLENLKKIKILRFFF